MKALNNIFKTFLTTLLITIFLSQALTLCGNLILLIYYYLDGSKLSVLTNSFLFYVITIPLFATILSIAYKLILRYVIKCAVFTNRTNGGIAYNSIIISSVFCATLYLLCVLYTLVNFSYSFILYLVSALFCLYILYNTRRNKECFLYRQEENDVKTPNYKIVALMSLFCIICFLGGVFIGITYNKSVEENETIVENVSTLDDDFDYETESKLLELIELYPDAPDITIPQASYTFNYNNTERRLTEGQKIDLQNEYDEDYLKEVKNILELDISDEEKISQISNIRNGIIDKVNYRFNKYVEGANGFYLSNFYKKYAQPND